MVPLTGFWWYLPPPPVLDRSPQRVSAHLIFTLLVGLIGWGVLLAATYVPELAPAERSSGALPFFLFLIVVIAARAMAFRLVPGSVLSLDSAFYVAAAICLGSAAAGRMVALALTLDALLRLLKDERNGVQREETTADSLGYVLYFGGMTGALLMACGWLFGVDRMYDADAVPGVGRELTAVFAVGTALLVAHYAIQGMRLWLRGFAARSYLRKLALPGIASEASLMPLAAVVVFFYHEDNELGFVLLGTTYLLVNFVFNRLSRASAELRVRVSELETLNGTARRLGASLELQELVEAVARETLAAIQAADLIALTHGGRDGRGDRLRVDCLDREQDQFERVHVERGQGAAGHVMTSGRTVAIPDLGASELDLDAGFSGVRAWLGAPIFMYGTCAGVLAVQSRRPRAFGPRDRRLLESIALQVSSALQNAHLYEMAMVDGLTGLFVRRYFDTRLAEEVERARRYDQGFSMIMMDIDDFKHLNDSYGHVVGDRVLRAVAEVVSKQMRGVDTAARYGGEEIAIILPRTDLVSAYNQAERIRTAIAEARFTVDPVVPAALMPGEVPVLPVVTTAIGVTASFGIAAFAEGDVLDAEDLVRRADRALYRAKQTGKNRVELYWADGSGPVTVRSVS